MRWMHVSRFAFVAASLAACGGSAAVDKALAAHADVASWERLDDGTPDRRLRDPRTGITFVRIDAGEFRSGPPGAERTVRVSRPFLLAETELTIAQWRRCVAELGGDATVPVPPGDGELPMPLSWHDAEHFCARLGYRLPTEAEWELACRGGSPAGDAPWSTPAKLQDHAWFNANAGAGARPVRTRTPNAHGLYDMLGNLWEWCSDWHEQVPFGAAAAPVDPQGPASGTAKLLRGGSWFTTPGPTPESRTQDFPDARNAFYGLRPARSL
jgi:formylglycine-generating enzyme required for sulfatase activity